MMHVLLYVNGNIKYWISAIPKSKNSRSLPTISFWCGTYIRYGSWIKLNPRSWCWIYQLVTLLDSWNRFFFQQIVSHVEQVSYILNWPVNYTKFIHFQNFCQFLCLLGYLISNSQNLILNGSLWNSSKVIKYEERYFIAFTKYIIPFWIQPKIEI